MALTSLRFVLLLAPLLFLARDAHAGPRAVSLREAVRAGLVEARGVNPGSYRRVTVELRNRTDRPLDVDLCGSSLRPKEGETCQRLGLGPFVGSPERTRSGEGSVIVCLEPGEQRRVVVRTVCLDAGLAVPTTQEFETSPATLPDVRTETLRWWADNPETGQRYVNEAVWQNRGQVRAPPPPTGDAPREPVPPRHGVAAFGGVAYLLDDGELTSVGPDGTRRFLGTCVEQVHSTSRGLYAVGRGAYGERELWVHEQTGDRPWRRVAELGRGSPVLDLVWVPVNGRDWFGAFAVSVARGRRHYLPIPGLLQVTAEGIRTVGDLAFISVVLVDLREARDLSFRPRPDGILEVGLLRNGDAGIARGGRIEKPGSARYEFGVLDLKTGRLSWTRTAWNVSRVVQGEAGVFGLTAAGSLKRDDGTRFHGHCPGLRCARILGVGRNTVWVRLVNGSLAAVGARSRVARRVPGATVSDETPFDVDPITDDLVLAVGEKVLRVRAQGGPVENVR